MNIKPLSKKISRLAIPAQSGVLFALRWTWGFQLAQAGFRHLTHVSKTVEFFTSLGIPFPLANVYISGTTEMVGGSLLMLGLGARLISLPLIFNFIVAYATASRDTLVQLVHGPRLDAYNSFINDDAFSMLMLALVMLAFGPGRISIDYLISRLFCGKSGRAGDAFQAKIPLQN